MYLFSKLNIYLSRRFLFWFATLTAITLFIMSFFEGLEYLRRASSLDTIPVWSILRLILFKSMLHYDMLQPFMVFITILIVLYRLLSHQEITVLRSCGLSNWRLLYGLSILILGIALFNLSVINPLNSVLNHKLLNLENKLFKMNKRFVSLTKTGLWVKESHDDHYTIIHIGEVDLKKHKYKDLSFFTFSDDGALVERLDAKKAFLRDNKWVLKNIRRWRGLSKAEKILRQERESLLTSDQIRESQQPPETISFWKMKDFIQLLEKTGIPTLAYELHYHDQIAKILYMLAMLFLGFCFFNRQKRTYKVFPLLMGAFSVVFILHFTSDLTHAFGLTQKVSPFLSSWGIPLIILTSTLSIFLHKRDF